MKTVSLGCFHCKDRDLFLSAFCIPNADARNPGLCLMYSKLPFVSINFSHNKTVIHTITNKLQIAVLIDNIVHILSSNLLSEK